MDVFTAEKRSQVMARIRSKNTAPEMTVRRALHALGYRFRLHAPLLPGRPDIVLPRLGLVIEVRGCFWHGHRCQRGRRPKGNAGYWHSKLAANAARDARNARRLRNLGWGVRVIWECAIRRDSDDELLARLAELVHTHERSRLRNGR